MRLFYVGASADGSRVAFTSGGRREDLYTIGADGSGLRQLTNDAFKDRGPVFHPDGKRLVIYSTRSGQYEAWSMHFDGSGATQLTWTEGDETIEPEISPDGRQLASMLSRYPGSAIARLDGPAPATIEQIPNPEAGGFEDPAWSSDGSRLAGMVRAPAGRMALGLYTLATRKHEVLPVDGEDPTWLAGDRSVMFLRSGELWAVDLASRRDHVVLTPAGLGRDREGDMILIYKLSGDQRSLFLVVWRNQADVWQLALP